MRFRSIIGTAAAASTLVMTGVVTAGPASAAAVACGTTITQTTTLTADVGPCAQDGIIIGADNITLSLNGHKIIGKAGAHGDHAGVLVPNHTGVTIRGKGTIQRFDAGVAIVEGSGNTVKGLTAKDNRNDGVAPPCNMGDGISMLNSNNNTITGNNVVGSGPFGGISLVEDSNGNQIKANNVVSSNLHGISGSGCGNNTQDEGIRLEGPGANNNVVDGNTVSDSLLAGIGIHSNVGCRNNPPAQGDTPNNDFNSITNNTVTGTAGAGESDGIKLLAQGPFGTVVCAAANTTITGNNSSNNERNGIEIPATSVNNTVSGNTVNANGVPGAGTPGNGDGIHLGGAIFSNAFTNNGGEVLDLTNPDQPAFVPCTPDPNTGVCPPGTDFAVLPGSGSGNVTAPLVAVGPINIPPTGFDTSASGCLPSDFAGFPVGAIALVQRGFCGRATKVANALAAGAVGVVMFNEGSTGRTGVLTLGVDPTTIPVVGTSFAVGQQLFSLTQAGPVTIHLVTNTTNTPVFVNVGAENNTLSNNKGFNNVDRDGRDDNPSCDNNAWTANKFGTVNQPCVKAGGGIGQVKP